MRYLYPRQVAYLHDRILEKPADYSGFEITDCSNPLFTAPEPNSVVMNSIPICLAKQLRLGYSLINNHPFLDGNKRTGFEAMRLILRLNGYDLRASASIKYDFVLKVALKKISEQQMADWMRKKSRPFRGNR